MITTFKPPDDRFATPVEFETLWFRNGATIGNLSKLGVVRSTLPGECHTMPRKTERENVFNLSARAAVLDQKYRYIRGGT